MEKPSTCATSNSRSDRLKEQLAGAEAHDAVLVAVSAGKQCEAAAHECWEHNKPDEYFFLEMYGSAVVEHLVGLAAGRICAIADKNNLAVLPHYSPGYSGWEVSDQTKLWKVLRAGNGKSFPAELEVLPTGMLRPKKSLLGIFGLSRNLEKARSLSRWIPCENCSLAGCPYRRAQYVHALPQFEDVRRLQSTSRTAPSNGEVKRSSLIHDGNYRLNARALGKWSEQRLELQPLNDGSLEARFCYEGTTCANMGCPLEYHYRIKLSPSSEGYRILEAHCQPAPNDTGHTQQCQYITDSLGLETCISAEKPLLGQSVNEILAWQRPSSPTGCYCDFAGRMHKWGLVLEVVHFALVQREKQTLNGS